MLGFAPVSALPLSGLPAAGGTTLVTAGDAGTGAEVLVLTAALSASQAGTLAEAGALTVALTGAEAATGVESATLPAAAQQASDSGTGHDAADNGHTRPVLVSAGVLRGGGGMVVLTAGLGA